MFESSISSLVLFHRGKVRDTYVVDEDHFLIVATDRLSAFDVVMCETIPEKGKILTQMSRFWFNYLKNIVPNHLTNIDPRDVVNSNEFDQVEDRAIVVKRCQPILIEAVVRGFLAGSGWLSYKKNQSICGVNLPEGLQHADCLPEPIFTPTTKAVAGKHDENITFEKMIDICGIDLAGDIQKISFLLYKRAREYAEQRGILVADTKFEFGFNKKGDLILIDEIFTPDSSRFWAKEEYVPGGSPTSFDKQAVRDWLSKQVWNYSDPAPHLPNNIVSVTSARYQEALNRLLI